jgi:probable phosphoglycerate mutase
MSAGGAHERTAGRRTVYLVRHGRTPLNAAGLLRGRIDAPLDDVGRAEAARLGELFAPVPLGAIVASPLTRAVDTAAAIAARREAEVGVDDDLVDRDYGAWAGRPLDEVETRFGSLDAAPGVEPVAAFVRRVTVALVRVAERATTAPAVVVAHDAVNRHVLAALVPALGAPERIPQRTGCWNRLEAGPDGWSAPVVDAVPGDGRRP